MKSSSQFASPAHTFARKSVRSDSTLPCGLTPSASSAFGWVGGRFCALAHYIALTVNTDESSVPFPT